MQEIDFVGNANECNNNLVNQLNLHFKIEGTHALHDNVRFPDSLQWFMKPKENNGYSYDQMKENLNDASVAGIPYSQKEAKRPLQESVLENPVDLDGSAIQYRIDLSTQPFIQVHPQINDIVYDQLNAYYEVDPIKPSSQNPELQGSDSILSNNTNVDFNDNSVSVKNWCSLRYAQNMIPFSCLIRFSFPLKSSQRFQNELRSINLNASSTMTEMQLSNDGLSLSLQQSNNASVMEVYDNETDHIGADLDIYKMIQKDSLDCMKSEQENEKCLNENGSLLNPSIHVSQHRKLNDPEKDETGCNAMESCHKVLLDTSIRALSCKYNSYAECDLHRKYQGTNESQSKAPFISEVLTQPLLPWLKQFSGFSVMNTKEEIPTASFLCMMFEEL
jgi:hypothetical protein